MAEVEIGEDVGRCERCNNMISNTFSESVLFNSATKDRENEIKTALLLQKSKTKTTFHDISVIKNIHKIAKDKNRKGLNICDKCIPFLDVLVNEKLENAAADEKNLSVELENLKRETSANYTPNELQQSQLLLEEVEKNHHSSKIILKFLLILFSFIGDFGQQKKLNSEEEKLLEQLNKLKSQIESENLEELKLQVEEKEKM